MATSPEKNTIGTWSLERKCLLLLGLALIVSIFLAFFAVQVMATRLVMETTRQSARDFARSVISWEHSEAFASPFGTLPAMVPKNSSEAKGSQATFGVDKEVLDASKRSRDSSVEEQISNGDPPSISVELPQGTSDSASLSNGQSKEFLDALPVNLMVLRDLRKDMLESGYSFELLRLDDGSEFKAMGGELPQSDIDRQSLYKIEAALAKANLSKAVTNDAKLKPTDAMDLVPTESNAGESPKPNSPGIGLEYGLGGPNQSDRLFQEYGPVKDFYYYYHPVAFRSSCLDCHAPEGKSANAGDGPMPFRVLRVKMPYTETRLWTIWSYSIMMAVALATIALSLLFFHWILKRLVIRPLRYLRDVSDEVSRGNLELRSEIDTDDEFYELSEAFNRMLRHLTETQVELRKVNYELDTRVDQLAQLNLQLYEANRLKSDFLASMSHELRTPLNSILGFSDVLQGFDTLNEKQKRYAANIQKSGRLLLEMINDILDLAKVEAGKMEVRLSQFDVTQVVVGHCDVVRKLAEDKNIDLQVTVLSPDESPILVQQDQPKIQQILTNLLSNAIKFTPQGGMINVFVGRHDDRTFQITVNDTGVGIAEHDLDSIFEKFRQIRTTRDGDALTREYSGTGLGLSIVREMCRLLGGEISLSSQLGKGSSFRVTLPIQYSREEAVASLPASSASNSAASAANTEVTGNSTTISIAPAT